MWKRRPENVLFSRQGSQKRISFRVVTENMYKDTLILQKDFKNRKYTHRLRESECFVRWVNW